MAGITLDIVIEGVDDGVYKKLTVKPVAGRTPSRAWDTFRKIVDNETEEEIKNGKFGFYYCIDCKKILERDISNGTSALLTHQGSHKRANVKVQPKKPAKKDDTPAKDDDEAVEHEELVGDVSPGNEPVNEQIDRLKNILETEEPLDRDEFKWFLEWMKNTSLKVGKRFADEGGSVMDVTNIPTTSTNTGGLPKKPSGTKRSASNANGKNPVVLLSPSTVSTAEASSSSGSSSSSSSTPSSSNESTPTVERPTTPYAKRLRTRK